ncbi:MurR/RpiR family transcriptional regulator [Anaerolentibacter hominis]|uniref:MurR/RpiR family transcriptional regulator n=1 Tax=Anaerolentibacter hominis TaxID=3079009 RepID=UPI0031B88716
MSKGISQIRNKYNTLSRKQKELADYILHNMEQVTLMTMKELADSCETSEATVVRFLHKLGYDSYQLFRMDMVKEYSELMGAPAQYRIQIEDGYQNVSPTDSAGEIKCKVMHAASAAILGIESLVDSEQIQKAADWILHAGQIQFFGSGGSYIIALDAFHKFFRLDLPVFCDSNSHFSLVKAGMLTERDVVLLISHTGESLEILACARNARKCGAKVIALTSYMNSSLAKMADLTLFSSHNELEYYTDAMVSRLIQLAVLDMIYLVVRIQMGDKATENLARAKGSITEVKTRRHS